MKWFDDGDQLVITYDNFENLQESPAVFMDGSSQTANMVREGGVRNMPVGDLFAVRDMLGADGGILWKEEGG